MGLFKRGAQTDDAQNAPARDDRAAFGVRRSACVEDHRVVRFGGKTRDDGALFGVLGVAARGKDHAEGRAGVVLDAALGDVAGGGGGQGLGKARLDAAHDRLRFRVAHAAVEFERLDGRAAFLVPADHQAGVKEARVHDAVFGHTAHGRLDDFAHRLFKDFVGHAGRGRVGAHAARVRALVAVEKTLVVLARGKRQHVFAVDHDDEARFFAREEFFDHDARAGRTELVAREHVVDGRVGFVFGHRHHDALARGKTVGLDDDRSALGADVGVRGFGVGEAFVVGRRDALALHEGLGKVLGAFKLSGFLGRAEDRQTRGAEHVDHALGKRGFGADDREVDFVFQSPVAQGFDVGDGEVFQARIRGRTGIARGNPDFVNTFGFGKTPGQRVLAAAAADH